jgi:hypothetical protein
MQQQEPGETSAASPTPALEPTRMSRLSTASLLSSVVGLSLAVVVLFADVEWLPATAAVVGAGLMVLGVGLGLVATNRVHRSDGKLVGRSQGIAAALVGCLPFPLGAVALAYFILSECDH